VLDPTKPQAPVWRDNFEKLDGKKHARCAAAGRPGWLEACLTRNELPRRSHHAGPSVNDEIVNTKIRR